MITGAPGDKYNSVIVGFCSYNMFFTEMSFTFYQCNAYNAYNMHIIFNMLNLCLPVLQLYAGDAG